MGCAGSTAVIPVDPNRVSKVHFTVERIVGQGGFGKVNAVVKETGEDSGTWYAMKSLTKNVIVERNHLKMVFNERNLLMKLQSPHLVNMHYAFQDDYNLYIIMDLCLGGDLHYQLSHSKQRCFSEQQTKFYIASVLLALEYMHAQGVLHRDIKPGKSFSSSTSWSM